MSRTEFPVEIRAAYVAAAAPRAPGRFAIAAFDAAGLVGLGSDGGVSPSPTRVVGVTLDRAFTVALAVAGAAGGVVIAVAGAFFIPTAYGIVSLGNVIALLGVGPFCHAVGRAAGSSLVGAVPGVAWLVATMLLATPKAEGDLVVTGSAFGMAFLLLGTLSAAAGIGTIRAGLRRSETRGD